jgi:hypothetical protein
MDGVAVRRLQPRPPDQIGRRFRVTQTGHPRDASVEPVKSSQEVVMPLSHLRSLRSSRVSLLASCLLAALAALGTAHAEDSVATGKLVLDPGTAVFVDQQGAESFGNAAIEARWKLDGQHLVDMTVTDRVHGRTFAVSAPFALVLADGSTIKSRCRWMSTPRGFPPGFPARWSRPASAMQTVAFAWIGNSCSAMARPTCVKK